MTLNIFFCFGPNGPDIAGCRKFAKDSVMIKHVLFRAFVGFDLWTYLRGHIQCTGI